jgi:hypothetical protein
VCLLGVSVQSPLIRKEVRAVSAQVSALLVPLDVLLKEPVVGINQIATAHVAKIRLVRRRRTRLLLCQRLDAPDTKIRVRRVVLGENMAF